MKETNTTAWFQSLEKALGKLAAIAAVVILLIFPLYVRDFYFDILNAKYQFYYITMLAVLIIAFIIFVFHVIQDFRYEDGKNVKVMFRSFSIKKMPLSHSFASIFLIVCLYLHCSHSIYTNHFGEMREDTRDCFYWLFT